MMYVQCNKHCNVLEGDPVACGTSVFVVATKSCVIL
jgi:hypothetical protein